MSDVLLNKWRLGDRLNGGGFGQVYRVTSDDFGQAVAKLVPKARGAERELLFVALEGVRNVVPVIDSGETADSWVLVMPEASASLRQHLDALGAAVPLEDALSILTDIAETLADLDSRDVHRDLKPENVLFLNGRWCLADFGISRYAEATTAADTRKFSYTPAYAAPEQWRAERATSATDVYAFGVMAYEIVSGQRPFVGAMESLREQHLHANAPSLSGVRRSLVTLVDECLYKPQQVRPTPADLLMRLQRATSEPRVAGLDRLQEVNHAEVQRRAAENAERSRRQTAEERRTELVQVAARQWDRIVTEIVESLIEAAPTIEAAPASGGGKVLKLGQATLTLNPMQQSHVNALQGGHAELFDVVAHSTIRLRVPQQSHLGYEGRSHSLWFCDAQAAAAFHWFETAFMRTMGQDGNEAPYALNPGTEAAKALGQGIMTQQPAWPFTELGQDDLSEFIGRWAEWFALGAEGRLQHPMLMPERACTGSYRLA